MKGTASAAPTFARTPGRTPRASTPTSAAWRPISVRVGGRAPGKRARAASGHAAARSAAHRSVEGSRRIHHPAEPGPHRLRVVRSADARPRRAPAARRGIQPGFFARVRFLSQHPSRREPGDPVEASREYVIALYGFEIAVCAHGHTCAELLAKPAVSSHPVVRCVLSHRSTPHETGRKIVMSTRRAFFGALTGLASSGRHGAGAAGARRRFRSIRWCCPRPS